MCVSDFDHEQEIDRQRERERDKTGNEALRGRSLQTTFHRLSAAPVEGLSFVLELVSGRVKGSKERVVLILLSTMQC